MDVTYREVAGFRTRVLSVSGTGTPILLLHGFSDHASGWRPFMAALEAQGRAAIAVDLPGFGRADDVHDGAVMPQLADFATEMIAMVAREHAPPVVVGNSLGGATMWVAAQQDRLPIAGLVAIAPAGFGFTPAVTAMRRVMDRLPGGVVVPPLPMWLIRGCLVRLYAVGAGVALRLDRSVARAWVGQFQTRADLIHTLELVDRVLAEIDEVGDLPMPAYPTMMVWGGRDVLVRPTGTFSGAETVYLARRGHCPQLRDANSLVKLVLDFADRLPGAAAVA